MVNDATIAIVVKEAIPNRNKMTRAKVWSNNDTTQSLVPMLNSPVACKYLIDVMKRTLKNYPGIKGKR